jgi:hypothetical protein
LIGYDTTCLVHAHLFREEVEKAGLPHVGETQYSHFQIVADTPEAGCFGRGLLLLGRHFADLARHSKQTTLNSVPYLNNCMISYLFASVGWGSQRTFGGGEQKGGELSVLEFTAPTCAHTSVGHAGNLGD